jgi:hypothetical protein
MVTEACKSTPCVRTPVLGLRLGENDATIDRQRVELDAQAGASAVRPGGADPRPATAARSWQGASRPKRAALNVMRARA